MVSAIRNIRGGTRLAFDLAQGITSTVENMHETIARRPLPGTLRPQGELRAHGALASGIYSLIRGVNHGLRETVDWPLARFPAITEEHASEREANFLGALNGVCGDHLERTKNPLAIEMGVYTRQGPVQINPDAIAAALPSVTGHIVILVHGLCLSEYSWHGASEGCIGEKLADHSEATPLYLRYNTGRHISTNGQELDVLLDSLSQAWPEPIESISLIGHSMGGLVIRSACWYAEQAGREWLRHLQRVICLGSPHHGAPLEKAGSRFDAMIRRIQYVEPLLVGSKRSAGIKDLKYGNLLDEDWLEGADAQPHTDRRRPVPTIKGVNYYVIAATVGRHKNDIRGKLLGDLLVREGSATGVHTDQSRCLTLPPEHVCVFYGMDHFGLLEDVKVHRKVLEWFG